MASEQEILLEARLDSAYAGNAPPGALPVSMQPGYYPPQPQGRTFQAPRSWWFYICLVVTWTVIAIVGAAGILGLILVTTTDIMSPVVAAPVTGANTATINFAATNEPSLTRLDALAITGSLVALSTSVSNVTGVGTAISVEQGGVEVWNGGAYFRDRIVSDTGIGYPSDRRVKRNIRDIASKESMDAINRLKPVTFDYMRHWALHRDTNGSPVGGATLPSPSLEGKHQRGFIAQDVKQVIPTAVDIISRTLAPDETNPTMPRHLDDFHIMDMSAIIPDVVGALQEMAKQLKAMQAENQELRAQVEGLKQA